LIFLRILSFSYRKMIKFFKNQTRRVWFLAQPLAGQCRLGQSAQNFHMKIPQFLRPLKGLRNLRNFHMKIPIFLSFSYRKNLKRLKD
jgi:hypothetical protein